MDICELIIFTISMALLGVIQKIPFTDIYPRTQFPKTLRGDFHFGHNSNGSGEISNTIPLQQPTATIPPIIEPAQPIPAAYITANSSAVSAPTCSPRPITLASGILRPTPTEITANTHGLVEVQGAMGIPFSMQMESPDWFSRLLESLTAPLLDPNGLFIKYFVLTVSVGVLLVALGAGCSFIFFTYTVVKCTLSSIARRAEAASADLDKVEAEITLRRSLLHQKLDALHSTMTKGVDESRETIESKGKVLAERVEALEARFAETSTEVHEECIRLRRAVRTMNSQYEPWPTRDELLSEYIKDFKDSLSRAKDDLEEEMYRVKNLIPAFRVEFHRAISKANSTFLGTLPNTFLEKKNLLQSHLRSIRETMNDLPYLTDLQTEAANARIEMEFIRAQMRSTVDESRKMLREMPNIQQEIEELNTKLTYLEEELSLSRLALKAVNKDEEPQDLLTLPTPWTAELPADLVNDLLGETASYGEYNDREKANESKETEEEDARAHIGPPSASSEDSCEVPAWLLREPDDGEPDMTGFFNAYWGNEGREAVRAMLGPAAPAAPATSATSATSSTSSTSAASHVLRGPSLSERNRLWSSSEESDSEDEMGNKKEKKATHTPTRYPGGIPARPAFSEPARPNRRTRERRRTNMARGVILDRPAPLEPPGPPAPRGEC
ncbi:hypothetical protein FQN50_004210 [Emmonsiellopsis sp. PD_5]|nr:hypothetical protein FQN50_004210 [Emmonsiellopsis sp. PD_5]